jgi:hypothetical protein
VKWRSKLGLVALAILGAAFIWAFIMARDNQPRYEDKRLSGWILSERWQDRKEAISYLGTNALPSLVEWIGDPAPRREVRLFGMRAPFPPNRGSELADRTLEAFRILGPRAVPALPSLVCLLKGTNVVVAERALIAIGHMGVEGVPALLDYVTNRHDYSSSGVMAPIGAMRKLGTNGVLLVPSLARCLKSQDSVVAGTAAIFLGNIGEQLGANADVVVAPLAEATESADLQLRGLALYKLGRMGASAESAVPALVRALGDSNDWVRMSATNALIQVAPKVLREKAREHGF